MRVNTKSLGLVTCLIIICLLSVAGISIAQESNGGGQRVDSVNVTSLKIEDLTHEHAKLYGKVVSWEEFQRLEGNFQIREKGSTSWKMDPGMLIKKGEKRGFHEFPRDTYWEWSGKLDLGTTYEWRAVVEHDNNILDKGKVRTFTTKAKPEEKKENNENATESPVTPTPTPTPVTPSLATVSVGN